MILNFISAQSKINKDLKISEPISNRAVAVLTYVPILKALDINIEIQMCSWSFTNYVDKILDFLTAYHSAFTFSMV